VEGEDGGVDAEEGAFAHDFYVPILEVEGSMRCYIHGVEGRLVIR
jgi:hypothetical protein